MTFELWILDFIMKDYYQILGISKNASSEDVKKAFHKLAHKHHPNKGGDEKKFKEINEAYQILSNKEKRDQYDRFGRVFEGGVGGEQNADSGFTWGWNWGNNAGPGSEPEVDFDFEGLGDIFGDLFGFGQNRREKKGRNIKKGKDINIDIEVSLEEILSGATKKFFLKKMVPCARCKGMGAEPGTSINECFSCRGTGEVQQIKRTIFGSFTHSAICPECGGEGYRPGKFCNVCKGEGRIKKEEEIEIFIPAGVDTNQVIRVEEKGDAGRKGGKPGNLYARILVKKHPVFDRKGDDLYISLPISFSQAALGSEIEIPTLEKKGIILKIPSGTESGEVLRVSGKGIPHFSSYGRGNLYVELVVKTPKKLTKKQKELLERMREEGI